MLDHKHVLLATLGGQPQVVTFTLDLLLKDNFPISEVIVIHPKAVQPRLHHSLTCLNGEFTGDLYKAAQRTIHFRSHVLYLDHTPINDITDDAHADGTLDTIHRLIGDMKRKGYHIHLSVTGGRRLMALLAISVASLNFDRYDHIWHIYTPDHIKEQAKDGKLMHAPDNSGVRLIKGQFISPGAYIFDQSQSFGSARQEQLSQMDAQEHARCENVVQQAPQREVDVLHAFAKGLDQQEVAQELHLSSRTIDGYKTKLLDRCRAEWVIEPHKHLGYHFLYKTFAPYFNNTEYTPTNEKTHPRNPAENP
ncbi:MAG: CRISPR-associated ring nuclease [Ktedonobacteraceae bacterium]